MPKKTKKKTSAKKPGAQPLSTALADLPDLPPRAGLPARDSIISISAPVAATMAGGIVSAPKYRIIHTNEMDEYEKAAASPMAFAASMAAMPPGDSFKGT